MIDREEIMRRWDLIRLRIAKGDVSDLPRLQFEDILDAYEERIATLSKALDGNPIEETAKE